MSLVELVLCHDQALNRWQLDSAFTAPQASSPPLCSPL